MKKALALFVAALLVLSFAACGGKTVNEPTNPAVESTDNANAADTAVMSYAEYVAAAVDTEVCVETYVQAKQGWWEKDGVGVATFYTQNQEGAYFLYNMPCTNDEYNQLAAGTKIRVKGYKSEWEGEVEITDATFEILEAEPYIAVAADATEILAHEASMLAVQNTLVCFKGLTVAAANENGDAFLYNWDGSGNDGDDLYFNVTDGENTYTFTVESYLCGSGTPAYEAVKALNVGDKIDVEGFAYWYNGIQPHVTSVTVAA